jgi:antitoxin component of MazEF toxin-antitoxin module
MGIKMTIQATVKKWGNSMGILLPREIVEKEKLKVNEKVLLNLVKKADLTDIFGSLERKMSGQDFKNMVRKGWK